MNEKIKNYIKNGFLYLTKNELEDLKNEILNQPTEDIIESILLILDRWYKYPFSIEEKESDIIECFIMDSRFEKYLDMIYDNMNPY